MVQFISSYCWLAPLSYAVYPCFGLTPSNPRIKRILVKPPYSSDPDSRDFPVSGVFAHGDFVESEILGDFLGGHYLGHGVVLQVWGISRWFADFAWINLSIPC